MKSIVILKIGSGFIFSFILIAIGAYNIVIGNAAFARSLFLWGIITTIVSIVWLLAYVRNKRVKH